MYNINDTLRYLHIGLPGDILRHKMNGNLEEAVRLIDLNLQRDNLPKALRCCLIAQREIMLRQPADYPYTYEEMLGVFRESIPDFSEEEFKALGCDVIVTTVDGSYGVKGFVTNALPENYTYFYTCGPEPMLKAVYKATATSGQMSFEERMGCGFGACMGCSCKTITGYKRICKEGPVMKKEEILWES